MSPEVRQPALPEMFCRRLAHKPARQTSREVYRRQRDEDKAREAAGCETRRGQALRLLAWHWNVTQTSPTVAELYAWGVEHGEHIFDLNSLRPRITELFKLGLVEPRASRRCRLSGKTARTWAVREAGSLEPR